MSAKYEIRIGDLLLREEILDVHITQTRYRHYRQTTADVVLRFNMLDPSLLDLYWPIIIDNVQGPRQRVFYGLTIQTHVIDTDKLHLTCEDASRYLKEHTSSTAFNNFPVPEVFFYLGRGVRGISTPEENVEGLSIKKNSRSFRVTMPVVNVVLPTELFVLGIKLRPRGQTLEDDKKIDKSNLSSDWRNACVWAEVVVEAVYFDEAAEKARKLIIRAVDLLNYFLRLSIQGAKIGNKPLIVPWNRDRAFVHVLLGRQAHVRDLSEARWKSYTHDFEVKIGEEKAMLSTQDMKSYSSLKAMFESIGDTATSRRLSSAMHWLRRGREASDPRDRLLDLWITLEFLTSETLADKTLTSTQIVDLSQALHIKAKELKLEDADRIVELFNSVINNPPLKNKFERLVADNSIPITDKERDIVWGPLRENRNDLEHGRKFDVDPQNLDVMEQMLSRIILLLAARLQ